MEPDVAFFDMDYTVLAVDCEQTWKKLLVEHGKCAPEELILAQHYLELHAAGKMPREEYLQFMLRDFAECTPQELQPLARENLKKYIQHQIYPDALNSIVEYRKQGIPTVLLSGSNRLIVEPIAKYLGITEVICTELEIHAGRYTGRVAGLYRIQEHKVSGTFDWCCEHNTHPNRAAFYGDSMSDIPMFEIVSQPYVVNPSDTLATMATDHGWRILNWSLKT